MKRRIQRWLDSLPPASMEHLARFLIAMGRIFPPYHKVRFLDTGLHLPSGANGSWQYNAGVWIGMPLYYKALRVPLGSPPFGNDVQDLAVGIPDSVFGRCGCCRRSWKWVHSHTTQYTEWSGCFPLCETCWQELGTPDRRIPFYRQLVDEWIQQSPEMREDYEGRWVHIERAVMAEGVESR